MSTDDALYLDLERLIVNTFPVNERRPEEEQRRLTNTEPHFHPHAIIHDGHL